MGNSETRARLGLWRRPQDGADDPQLSAAHERSEQDAALRQWWEAERKLDRTIGEKLHAAPVPPDLREQILASRKVVRHYGFRWGRALAYAAAAIAVLAVLFSSWRGPFQPNDSLADYRDEMVGFIRIAPSLAMETGDLDRIQSWLAGKGNFTALQVPEPLQKMEPVGCRTLRFRARDVALICFRREKDSLVHLFVVDRSAFPRMRSGEKPVMGQSAGWQTAAWENGGKVYLLTAQGDEKLLRHYLAAGGFSALLFSASSSRPEPSGGDSFPPIERAIPEI